MKQIFQFPTKTQHNFLLSLLQTKKNSGVQRTVVSPKTSVSASEKNAHHSS